MMLVTKEKLVERVSRRAEERDRIKNREADKRSHDQEVRTAARMVETDFWCEYCKKDFTAVGIKRIGYAGEWPTAWYDGLCRCGKTSIRRITDKSKDVYYYKSAMIKFQRVRNYNDTLAPFDDLFKIIYPKKWKEMEQKKHDFEKNLKNQYE